jgi:flavin reductase (DIM6/NTAB) family NADH-FMN oxidoreductase RutF
MMKQTAVVPAAGGWAEKDIKEFSGSPFARIGDEWLLLSGGNVDSDKSNWNTMTVSWGGLGVLWGRNVAFVFIRPQRYTLEFVNPNPLFTLSFFGKAYRGALNFCGANSGRDFDKAAETGLTPIEFKDGTIGFKEAKEVIACRKLYTHDFDPSRFLDPSIGSDCYPGKDYHRMFIGEIVDFRVRA